MNAIRVPNIFFNLRINTTVIFDYASEKNYVFVVLYFTSPPKNICVP